MKRYFGIIVVIVAMLATTTQVFGQQYSVRRIVRAQFVAGTLTIPADTVCANSPSQQITGTAATGGQPTPATTYQWHIYTNTTPVWTSVPGAIGLNLQTGILPAGDYQYMRIDNNSGCGSIDTTNIIAIHVWDPFLAGIATGGGNFCWNTVGTTTTCTPATGGDPATITQEVYISIDNGITWTATGNTTLSYTPAGLMTAPFQIRWQFTSNCGTTTSNIVSYNVYSIFAAGVASTTTISPICSGSNGGTATATTATGGAPATTVEWETSGDGIVFTNTGNTTLAYSFGTLAAPIWARVRYMNGCDTLYSNTLFIDVYTAFTDGSTPTIVGTDTTCFGTDFGSIDAIAAVGGVPASTTYQWRNNVNGGGWNNILLATAEDYDPGVLNIAGTHQYQRVATNPCGTATTTIVTIYVYPTFNAGVVGTHADVCSGSAQPPIIEMTPASGGSGNYTYQWIVSTDNEVTWSNAPGASTSPSYSPATIVTPVDVYYYWRRTVTDIGGCGTGTSTAPALP